MRFLPVLMTLMLGACTEFEMPCANCVSGTDTDVTTDTDTTDTDTEPTTPTTGEDRDGDGVTADLDCNDENADIHPGAEDIDCDGIDQNCDGIDGLPPEYRSGESSCGGVDSDGDQYMNVNGAGETVDCDDTDATIYPGAEEILDDGIDQDCDGEDLESPPEDTGTEPEDTGDDCVGSADDCDGDGHRDFVDCDDHDPTVHDDCEADTGDTDVDPDDADGDGHQSLEAGGDDCDDSDASIHPDAEEIPYNGIDEDCTGNDLIDVDCDGAAYPLDCNDNDDTVSPMAVEICGDDIDNDCNGSVDDVDADGEECPVVDEPEDTGDTDEPEPMTLDAASCDDGDATLTDEEKACTFDLDGDGESDLFLLYGTQSYDDFEPIELLDFTFGGGCFEDGEEIVVNGAGYYVLDFASLDACEMQFNAIQDTHWIRMENVCEEGRDFCDLQDNGSPWEEWNFSLSWDPEDGGLVGAGNGLTENCQLDESC